MSYIIEPKVSLARSSSSLRKHLRIRANDESAFCSYENKVVIFAPCLTYKFISLYKVKLIMSSLFPFFPTKTLFQVKRKMSFFLSFQLKLFSRWTESLSWTRLRKAPPATLPWTSGRRSCRNFKKSSSTEWRENTQQWLAKNQTSTDDVKNRKDFWVNCGTSEHRKQKLNNNNIICQKKGIY